MPLLYSSFLGSGGGSGDGPGTFPASDYQPENLDLGTEIIARGSSMDWDENIREIGNVIYDAANQEYRLVYTGYQGAYDGNDTFVGYAYSSDGVSWTKGGKLTLGADRNSEDPYLVKNGSTYYLYVEDKEDVPFRDIRCYTSSDFSTWTDQGEVLGPGSGWEATDVSSPTVWIEGSTWYMLYEGRATNQNGAVGLATSSDGLTWSKSGSNPVLVGQNVTFGYTGPISWAYAVVPDDIVKAGSTYVLSFHGQNDSGDVASFWSGIATSTDLTTWTDALGRELYTYAQVNTVMYLPTSDTLYFSYAMPGMGIVAAEEGPGDANWASVVLYLAGYDEDGATTFLDLSERHSLTRSGNTQIDTAQSKFGPSSILFDGTGDYLSASDSADWDFGSGDFTIQAWIRLPIGYSDAKAHVICSQWATSSRAWTFDYFNGTLRHSYSTNGTATAATLTASFTPTGDTWHHVAITRASGTVRFFGDGALLGSSSAAVTYFNSTNPLRVGRIDTSTGNDFGPGHIEGLEILKGAALYTAAFTAPTAPAGLGPVPS